MTRVRTRSARLALLLPLMAMLSACATPQQRIRAGLIEAGITPPVADCMAQRMADRLSLGQLRKLASLKGLREHHAGRTTIEQYLHSARALGDPEILGVVTSSAAVCAIRHL